VKFPLKRMVDKSTQLYSKFRSEVSGFHIKMHAKDYFDREASLETYLEWKPILEKQKVPSMNLKLKGQHFNGEKG
jgi:hypothetical protein